MLRTCFLALLLLVAAPASAAGDSGWFYRDSDIRARSGLDLRNPAQRPSLRGPPQRASGGAGLGPAEDRRGLAPRGGRGAGLGPFRRAYGVPRNEEFRRRRGARDLAAARRQLRKRHQRLHRADPDRLHARPSARRPGLARHQPQVARRHGRHRDLRPEDRRRRARGRPLRIWPADRAQRQASRDDDAALLRRPQIRRARHDRHRGDPEGRDRGGAQGLLRALVPARPGDPSDGRRRRPEADGGADRRAASAAGSRRGRRPASPITARSPRPPSGPRRSPIRARPISPR